MGHICVSFTWIEHKDRPIIITALISPIPQNSTCRLFGTLVITRDSYTVDPHCFELACVEFPVVSNSFRSLRAPSICIIIYTWISRTGYVENSLGCFKLIFESPN